MKNIEHCTLNNLTNIHVMTFNVHLAQFDVAPTRYLITFRCKIAKYVTLHKVGGLRNVTTCDKEGRGKKILKFV